MNTEKILLRIESRLDKIESRLDKLETRVEKGFAKIEKDIEFLAATTAKQFEETHKHFDSRCDKLEQLVGGHERRIEIVEDRLQQVKTKTGMKFV